MCILQVIKPSYYGLEDAEGETVNSYLSRYYNNSKLSIDVIFSPSFNALIRNIQNVFIHYLLFRLVQTALEDLEDSRCIKMTENSMESTMLGSFISDISMFWFLWFKL